MWRGKHRSGISCGRYRFTVEQEQAGVETVQVIDPSLYAAALAVNADRAALGLAPIPINELDQALTEFGRISKGLNRFKDWVKGQITNPEFEKKIKRGEGGRFARKFRGDLDLGDGAGKVPRIDLDAVNITGKDTLGEGGWRDQPGLERGRPASSPPSKEMIEVDMDNDLQQLRDAGFTDKQIGRWKGRGKVYRADTGDDIPPIYTFIAHPDAMVEAGSSLHRRDYDKAAERLAALRKEKAKGNNSPDIDQRIAAAEQALARADAALAARIERVEAAYGSGTEISDWDKDVAEELAALTADSVRRYYRPEHRTQPFMIELDETQLIRPTAVLHKNRDNPGLTETKRKQLEEEAKQWSPFNAMQGLFIEGINLNQTDRGNIISVNRVSARAPIKGTLYEKRMAPSGAETIGQDFIRHEPGHGADIRGTGWASDNGTFKSFMQQTRELFPKGYMNDNPREWFAEMFKVMASGGGNPQQQLAALAFRNMFILNPSYGRPITPPTNWVTLNQKWLQNALAAQAAGKPIPPLPNPDLKKAFAKKVPKLPGFK